MKSNTKSSLRSTLVTLVLLGSAGFFGWLFWTELNRTVENVGGVVVGEVVEVRGQAQRRYDRQSRWGSLKGDEPIYNLDAIRTAGDSGATIVLKSLDETGVEIFDEIALGPDTYIILDLFGDTRNINFVGGDISATGSEGLTVSAEGTVVSADGGSVNLSRQEGQETSVSVTDGEARVLRDGEQTTVDRESILRIDEDSGTTVREQTAAAPIAPKSNALLLSYDPVRQVDFTWNLFADWDNPVLEVASDPSFGEESTISTPARDNATLELEPGQWYWRVGNADGEESGPISIFTVDQERPAIPIAPAEDLVIPFRGDAPAVSLQWSRAWFADSYTVEMSRTASFAETSVVREINGVSVLVEDLEAGQWWWRVRPNYRRGILDQDLPPENRSFALEQRIGHDPVQLVSPTDDMSISALEVRDGIDFRWRTQDGIISYRINVSTDPEFSRIVANVEEPENWRTLLTAPEPGSYYWRVNANAADGLPVPSSEIRRFEITPVTGSVELVDPAPGETKELEPYSSHTFVWRSGVPGTARFILQRINGTERTRIIESLVQGETFTAPLPGEGSYTWQVQILDSGGRNLVESPEGSFRLRSQFSPPELVTPRPGDSLSLVGNTTVALGWTPVPGADAYRVVLRGNDGSIVGRDDRVTGLEREFTLSSNVAGGVFTVELNSIRDNPPAGASRNSSTASYSFNIGDILSYSAAVPTAPADNTSVSALDALRDGIVLRWSQNPPLGRWTVELDNGRLTRLYQTTVPQLELESLDPGRYTWKIRSRDEFGQEAPDSRSSSFTVSDFPDPPAPVLITPSSGEEVDMTGARDLTFAWQNSPGTDFYDLALYVEGSRTPLLRETNLTGSRYVLENLRILDVGNFVLEMTAYTDYPDVGVTRSSETTRVPFSLSVNIAKDAPTILTDELQYAD